MHKIKSTHLYALLILSTVAILITIFTPHKVQSLQYQGMEGKPWQGELLVAPYNFSVRKSPEVLQAQQDSVRHEIKPYFDINQSIGKKMLSQWEADWSRLWSKKLSKEDYYYYVHDYLETLYTNGVVNAEDLNRLHRDEVRELYLRNENKEARLAPVTQLTTLLEANDGLLVDVPEGLCENLLKSINFTNYLQANVSPNEAVTQKAIDDEVARIAKNSGEIQQGERIIGYGEIISADTYQILQSLNQEIEERSGALGSRGLEVAIGSFLVNLSILVSIWFFLFFYRPQVLDVLKNTIFFSLLILIFVLLTIYVSKIDASGVVYVIPYVSIAILIRTFFESRTAIYIYIATILLSAIFVSNPIEFMIVQFVAGLMAVFSLRSLTSRAQIIRATFLIFVVYNVISSSYSLMSTGSIGRPDLTNLFFFSFNLIFNMFSYLLVYLIENLFGYVSNISLVELSDVNRPLPRMLSERAPGTFQHSMQVALLASDAAAAIGADARLVRAGAIYHDIGKMLHPEYFTENQGSVNPHDQLTAAESAAVIIRHVTDGIALAQKYKLPPAIQNFIPMHHGRSKTKFFFNKYCNEHPGEAVDTEKFTYPGPKPNTKETGILMLADAIEASSRSLTELTKEKLIAHVDKIVSGIVSDGMLNDTPLTFRDIEVIKDIFSEKLATIYHTRIAYPELKQKPMPTVLQ